MTTAFIGLGSNVGNGARAIARAVEGLSSVEGTQVTALSSLYRSSPVDAGGGWFVNAVARIETGLGPARLLGAILELEKAMGRERTPGKDAEPRSIDLDLLLYGNVSIRLPGLAVPHPRMDRRRFVMEPLAELDAELRMPHTGDKARDVAERLRRQYPDQEIVRLGRMEDLLKKTDEGSKVENRGLKTGPGT